MMSRPFDPDISIPPTIRLRLPSPVREQIAKDTYARFPHEACGALFGTYAAGLVTIGNYKPLANMADNPHHAFLMEPEEWVKCCFTPGLIGIYHSHPTTLPEPSAADLDELPQFGSLFSLYMIGSPATKKPPSDEGGFSLNTFLIVKKKESSQYELRKITTFC
ncbi:MULTISPECIES: Mov34/MPN/PAD-1 family protein [Paenibacillus]|uniref:Mov34/MPN/PAD-1 family protein n=1 Tax=Paenibacillus TaxID=44249 RepID=UPI002FE10E33